MLAWASFYANLRIAFAQSPRFDKAHSQSTFDSFDRIGFITPSFDPP